MSFPTVVDLLIRVFAGLMLLGLTAACTIFLWGGAWAGLQLLIRPWVKG